MSSPRTTRRLPELLGLLLLVVALAAGAAAPAVAGPGTGTGGDPDTSTSTTAFADGDQRIIPRPDSGREPTEAGDRGGALQLALLALILAGVAFVGWRIRRSVFDLPEPSGRSKTETQS